MKKLSILLTVLLIVGLMAGCTGNNQQSIDTPPVKEQLPDNTPSSTDTVPEAEPELDNTETEPVNVTIAGLKGPTSIGMIKLIDEKALNSDTYNVEYIAESAPDALTAKIIKGEIQISAVPANVASVLYNKTEGGVQLLALNTVGNLYIVGTDEITDIAGLEGKTLGMSAKGSTPDYAMSYILKQNGLEDKVELNYMLDHATLAQAVIAGDVAAALLPQPFVTQVTMKNENVKILLDLNEEFERTNENNSTLAMGSIIVNKEFAENNKEFVSQFLKEYQDSVSWVLANPADASILVEKNEIMPSAALVEKAIPYCGITFKSAQDAKDSMNGFFQILFDSNPASVGGKLPDEDFYYSE